MRKHTVLCAILMAMLMVLIAGTALATEAKLSTTQSFLNYLGEKGIKYTYHGMTESSGERVSVGYTLDNYSSQTCNFFFKESEDEVDLRMWNIITASAGKNFTLSTLNALNSGYKYAKFVLDESDSTVQAEMDMFISKDNCGESVYKAMKKLFDVVDADEVAKQILSLE